MDEWVLGTVIRRLGPFTDLVRVGCELHYVLIGHLLKTDHFNSEDAFGEVVAGVVSSSVVIEYSTTITENLFFKVNSRTTRSDSEPCYRTSSWVPNSKLSTAQEPASKSLAHIPVAVSEIEPPPQA